jgi:hypothetical protein
LKFSLKDIFKRRESKSEQKKTVTPSFKEAETGLKSSMVERELVNLLLKALKKAEDKGLIESKSAKKLSKKYQVELEKVEGEIDNSMKLLKLLELSRVRGALYSGYWDRIQAIEAAMKELTESMDMDFPSLMKPPQPQSNKRKVTTPHKELQPLKEEILKVMEKLEEIEVEG